MADPLRLMCVAAHPDDETLGMGGTLARYAAEGVEVSLVIATRGERGWMGPPAENPGPAALGQRREAELRAAARTLGIRDLWFLDYIDGDLDQADPAEAIERIAAHLRAARPQVVITFGPDGAYGHPDHIAISQMTTAAVMTAASNGAAHAVSKLYYRVWTAAELAAYIAVLGPITMTIDGVERADVAWPDWSVTTWIDTTACWPTVWEAALCHQSQLPADVERLARLPPEQHARLWGAQSYYRALSLVNGGRTVERDLFAGLR